MRVKDKDDSERMSAKPAVIGGKRNKKMYWHLQRKKKKE